jgi:hypothetical protein
VPLAPGEIEICGMGRYKRDDAGEMAGKKAIEARVQQVRVGMVKALVASGDEADRATGLYLQALPQRGASPGAQLEGPPPDAASVDALARMAASTQVPLVYALALQACDRQPGKGACQLLSAEQWARIDPTNAAPWIRVLDQANRAHDVSGAANAAYRITQSTVNDMRVTSLTNRAIGKIPTDTPAYARTSLATEVLGASFGAITPYNALVRYCDKTEVADANRQQSCSALAEVLTTRSATLVDLGLGTTIGERAGWPTERVQALRDERDAAFGQSVQALGKNNDVFSCAAIDRQHGYITSVATLGEMAALRRSIKLSSDSVEVQAKRYRDRTGKSAAAAASGATAGLP